MKILKNNFEKGFTLIEIMTVVALLAILSSIFLSSSYRKNQVRNSLLTDSVDLATSLQDMQSRAATFVTGNDNVNNVGYGIFFDNLDPGRIESFYKSEGQFSSVDIPNASLPKPDQDIILNYGNKIATICLNGCDTFKSQTTKLAIFFVKPKSYANFSVLSEDGVTYTTTVNQSDVDIPITHACLELEPTDAVEYRHIDVFRVGQISAAYGPCQ